MRASADRDDLADESGALKSEWAFFGVAGGFGEGMWWGDLVVASNKPPGVAFALRAGRCI